MTPLLTRLAQRAGGLPPGAVVVAAPALPARFAPAEAGEDAAEPPVTSATSPAPVETLPPARRAETDLPAVRSLPAAPAAPAPPVTSAPTPPGPAEPADTPLVRTTGEPRRTPSAGRPEPREPTPDPPTKARPSDDPGGPGGTGPVERTSLAAAPVVRVTASPAVEPAPPRLPPEATSSQADAGAREPDVVHVTIGRVEVRGATPAPSPVPPAASAPRAASGPEPLSLGEYLRGRREAR